MFFFACLPQIMFWNWTQLCIRPISLMESLIGRQNSHIQNVTCMNVWDRTLPIWGVKLTHHTLLFAVICYNDFEWNKLCKADIMRKKQACWAGIYKKTYFFFEQASSVLSWRILIHHLFPTSSWNSPISAISQDQCNHCAQQIELKWLV